MRVFVSHASEDKARVRELADALRSRGFDPWLDEWEIHGGDDFVRRINEGIHACPVAVIVFSASALRSPWVDAETSYLAYARIKEGKVVVPLVLGDVASESIPALLRPVHRHRIDRIDDIAAALRAQPQPASTRALDGPGDRVVITLKRVAPRGVDVRVTISGLDYGKASLTELPRELQVARDAFLRGALQGTMRAPSAHQRAQAESLLAQLGRQLRDVCLPSDAQSALAALVQPRVGNAVDVVFEADDPELLGLPFEALRLADDSLLATAASVVVWRRPLGLAATSLRAPAGPIKVLVAVGAPDEGTTNSVVLDLERELQSILDAVEAAQRSHDVEVRLLEVGHPSVIGEAMVRDAYHVLHLSCHGSPGSLELEDEDGRPFPTTASTLLEPIVKAQRALPLVFLNACHGGVSVAQTSSFAESLLRAGVPCVVSMQTSVTDHYATRLAAKFYENLSVERPVRASRALARARKDLEAERLRAVANGAPAQETQPEVATATLFVAGEEPHLADFALRPVPLRDAPVHAMPGPVPQLSIEGLVGRRRELRTTLRVIRDSQSKRAGVVLVGLGGIGKSAIAGRAMCRLAEEHRIVVPYVGVLDLARLAVQIAVAVLPGFDANSQEAGKIGLLLRSDLDERVRSQLVGQILAALPLVLVLDDFEQNLVVGGAEFKDPAVRAQFAALVDSARVGRLLITCRHPVPGFQERLEHVDVGPLSVAQTRKLIQRLPALRGRGADELVEVLRLLGGHPRMLELLDALLRVDVGRWSGVNARMAKLIPSSASGDRASWTDAMQTTLELGARDVLLGELLELAERAGARDVLLQAAVSNLSVTPAGIAHMLAGLPADAANVVRALDGLARLSLIERMEDGSVWVHRWIAEGLRRIVPEASWRKNLVKAGEYREWRVKNETHGLGDAIEAARNYLSGGDVDRGANWAIACCQATKAGQQTAATAVLAREFSAGVPPERREHATFVDFEAKAALALGDSARAVTCYEGLLTTHQKLAEMEPDRADYERDLSLTLERLGSLYVMLGQSEKAREYFSRDLEIAERLAKTEPDRADYQRHLSVTLERLGDLYVMLGQGEKARESFQISLAIRELLANTHRDRADYQRDLSVSLERLGDLCLAFGDGEKAHEPYLSSLAIAERLAKAEPDRADYQRDLSVSLIKLADLCVMLGQREKARESFQNSLAIIERLAKAEPDRADYQRDLSVLLIKFGDLYVMLGQGEKARESFQNSLAIIERLAKAEPDRADYQRDLSASLERLGDLYVMLGQGEKARESFQNSLAIIERLAKTESDRADYQRDLIVSLVKLADAMPATARASLSRAVAIARTLQASEQLAPQDAWMVEDLERRLVAAPPNSPS